MRKKRKSSGGSGRKTFTEGWVEFKSKDVAKAVAASMNNTPLGQLQCLVSNIRSHVKESLFPVMCLFPVLNQLYDCS